MTEPDPNHMPLPPVRERTRSAWQRVTLMEVTKAVEALAKDVGRPVEALGTVGCPVELYEKTPVLRRALALLFNAVLRSGRIPKRRLRLYLIPIRKPGKDPSQCGSRLPISFICTGIKVLEGAL